MVEYLKSHARGALVSFGGTIVALQLILPAFFDLLTSLILLGLVWVAQKLD